MFSKVWLVFIVVYIFSFTYAQKNKKFFRNDYTYIEAAEGFYKINLSRKTWADAKRTCALEGASLYFPENIKEAQAVMSFWNATQPYLGWAWVGLSDIATEGEFETVEGKLASEVYSKWHPGNPNNYGGKENCVYMYKEGNTIDDYGCDYQYAFICKKSLQSLHWNYCCDMPNTDYIFNGNFGKCYKLHMTPLNWTEAYAVCHAEQSQLAVVNSRMEAEYLVNLTESTPKPRLKENYQRGLYHLGFHNVYDGSWQTVKGTPLNVSPDVWWENYQPAADGRDGCGSMFFNGYLVNIDCNVRSFFICEHELDKSKWHFYDFCRGTDTTDTTAVTPNFSAES